MLKWLSGGGGGGGSGRQLPVAVVVGGVGASGDEEVRAVMTDDPLAAIGAAKQIYSVSRSVHLPRVALRNGVGVNPLFVDNLDCTTLPHKPTQLKHPPAIMHHVQETTSPQTVADKTASSGYGSHGGSSHDSIYVENVKLKEDAVAILEQNASFVKSILVAVKNKNKKSRRSVGSLGSSAAGTLSTIPEGKVDFCIPRPVWPKPERKPETLYDSLVDESLLLYTSLSYVPENDNCDKDNKKVSANEILKELSDTINAAVDGKIGLSPEQILKCINDRLATGLDILQQSTEEDMRKLSVNLSNSEHINTVMRAFSNSSSSGNSSQASEKDSPDWGSRIRTSSSETDEIYQVPSGSSSSGFSDVTHKNIYEVAGCSQLPVFVHDNLSSVPNGVRNAMIYGTLCRGNVKPGSANERLLGKEQKNATVTPVKGSLLAASADAKPSVWEIYYGAGLRDDDVRLKTKAADTLYFPAGRPETDFTLDVPRSELLMRKMKAAKKWRFRCRLVTSLLGLVFFLLSLMAVSLMLTRGKRMFGSMV